jgi:ribonuclease MRP protein subunit RMP1
MRSACTTGICKLYYLFSTYWVHPDAVSRSFTQLIAVGPFAVIGLVLMASTARVCRVTGVTDLYEEIGSEDMKNVLKSMDDGAVVRMYGELRAGNEEDVGEVIERDE